MGQAPAGPGDGGAAAAAGGATAGGAGHRGDLATEDEMDRSNRKQEKHVDLYGLMINDFNYSK